MKKENKKKELIKRFKSTSWTEDSTISFMSKIRIFLEENNYKQSFPILNLFCNFTLHPGLSDSTLVWSMLKDINTVTFNNFKFTTNPNGTTKLEDYMIINLPNCNQKIQFEILKYFFYLKQEINLFYIMITSNDTSVFESFPDFLISFLECCCKNGAFEVSKKQIDLFEKYIQNPSIKLGKNKTVIELLLYLQQLIPPPNNKLSFKKIEFLKLTGTVLTISIKDFEGLINYQINADIDLTFKIN